VRRGLVEIDQTPPAQVVNSNAWVLAAAVAQAGAVPVVLPIARDRLEDIRARVEEAASADVVLSTGGVSVGEFDFVRDALDAIGVKRKFWKVAQKPGKPLPSGRAALPFFGLGQPRLGSRVSRSTCGRRCGSSPGIRRSTIPWCRRDSRSACKAKNLTEFVRVA
jgi:molybdenum cofactor synthesis domain-containing protein